MIEVAEKIMHVHKEENLRLGPKASLVAQSVKGLPAVWETRV